jgi:hypothetical protein
VANNLKYSKYVSEVNPNTFMSYPDDESKKISELNHYDYRDNIEAPHFMETNILGGGMGGVGIGSVIKFTDPRIYYSGLYQTTPHKGLPNCRLYYETRSFISLDPEHPDDIGVTMHAWMGEGKDAELHMIDKPTTQLNPPGTVSKPIYAVELHGKPGMVHGISDNPLEAVVWRGTYPQGFEKNPEGKWIPLKVDPMPKGSGKYGTYFSEIDIKSLPVYPKHKGKAARVMFYDGSVNPEAPHCIDCHLIYGAGIGFGLGDEKKLPLLPDGLTDECTSYEPFLPHMHPFYQTYSFIPSDNNNLPYLGGTVEFHIGQGKEQEVYTITKATTILIPRDTVHLPLYVKEVHKPFAILTVLDSPIWAGIWAV